MRTRLKLLLTSVGLLLFFAFMVAVDAELGADADETRTDLRRPEIVGETQSNAP